MFKIFLAPRRPLAPPSPALPLSPLQPPGRLPRKVPLLLYATTLLLLHGAGCQTLPSLPAVNLKDPRWTVREGEAVWKSKRDQPSIAGEFLVATSSAGDTFVQFTKNPFPMITAQTSNDVWQLEIPAENKRYTGRGKPPGRAIWFYLPRLFAGENPPEGWTWRPPQNGKWRLENKKTGELLEGIIDQ